MLLLYRLAVTFLQYLRDTGAQCQGLKWFDQVAGSSALQTLFDFGHLTFGGEQNDGNGRGQWIPTHSVEHLQPRHFWHHNIKQRQVWLHLSNQLQGALAILGLREVVGTQQKLNQTTDVGLIISNNQVGLHAILLSLDTSDIHLSLLASGNHDSLSCVDEV